MLIKSTSDYHHQHIETSTNVESVAQDCLRHNVFELSPERATTTMNEVPDLFISGLSALCSTKRLTEYKKKVHSMGIRGVVELGRRAEREDGEEEVDEDYSTYKSERLQRLRIAMTKTTGCKARNSTLYIYLIQCSGRV